MTWVSVGYESGYEFRYVCRDNSSGGASDTGGDDGDDDPGVFRFHAPIRLRFTCARCEARPEDDMKDH